VPGLLCRGVRCAALRARVLLMMMTGGGLIITAAGGGGGAQVVGAYSLGPLLFTHAGLRPAMARRLLARHRIASRGAAEGEGGMAAHLALVISAALRQGVSRCRAEVEEEEAAAATATGGAINRAGVSQRSINRSINRRPSSCLHVGDTDELFSAGPDRRGTGLGGPFWTDWSVLRDATPQWGGDHGGQPPPPPPQQRWVWPPATVSEPLASRRCDPPAQCAATPATSARQQHRGTAVVVEPSGKTSFIQVVGHSAARCAAAADECCQPIRWRAGDLGAIVADAGVSDHVSGNRAYLQVVPRHGGALLEPGGGAESPGGGSRIVAVVRGVGGRWSRHDITREVCSPSPASSALTGGRSSEVACGRRRRGGGGGGGGGGMQDDLSLPIALGPAGV
jgi:hypothetical protein